MPFNPTPEQEVLIAHNVRFLARVLAGPGTGKSATVIALVRQALTDHPELKAKLLTFTRAATAELIEKVGEDEALTSLEPSTIHAFCISVLLSNPGVGEFPRPLRIADDWEQREIVRPTLARRLNIGLRELDNLLADMAANWESLDPNRPSPFAPEERARFLGAWQEHRRILGYTLLSELPYALHHALQQHPDLQGCDHELLVVDEYQDLNACDLAVLSELSSRGCKIIAAGDDDQSIYSFRKAHPEGIRRFIQDYQDANDYLLSVTMRCGRRIIEWANWVISQDPDRPRGRLLTPHEEVSEGTVGLLSFRSDVAEARGIAALAYRLINEDQIDPSQILVLLRSDHNQQFSARIKEELSRRGIRYSDASRVNAVLGDPKNRQLLALCRLAANREDSLGWLSLLKLAEGLGEAFVSYVYERARAGGITFARALLNLHQQRFIGAPQGTAPRAIEFADDVIDRLGAFIIPEETPELGWPAWLQESVFPESGTEEFWQLLKQVDDMLKEDTAFGQFLNQITPLAKDAALKLANGLRIMSMASSKGLTVEATIIAGLEAGLVPLERNDVDHAEERRLLYVGMTRARRFLYCTWARQRTGPTARQGRANPGVRRNLSPFLEGGPVQSTNGDDLIG